MEKDIIKAVEELDEDKVMELVHKALDEGAEPLYLLDLIKKGMDWVGKLYEDKEYFIADLIMAGLIFKEVLELEEMAAQFHCDSRPRLGTLIIGTVKGDLHDIGKDIFRGMMEASGFRVVDLGVDVPKETFVKKAKEFEPDIIGLSGVLNFTIDTMKDTVDALAEANLRDKVKVIIGGNHLTKDACEYVGADYYTSDASIGMRVCREWLQSNKKRGES